MSVVKTISLSSVLTTSLNPLRSLFLRSKPSNAMIFTTVLSSVLLFVGVALADTDGYDTTYDNASGDMNAVSCSDGANGLASRYPTFGSLPTYPNIGGASAIAGWGSAECGSCWSLTYENAQIYFTAIDHSADGFVLSQEALDTLTDGQAVALGHVDVTATQVDSTLCGI